MRMAYNKINVDKKTKKIIRSMFFRQEEMKNIEKETKLTERIIRRIINENKWMLKRERYLKYLAYYAYRNNISLAKISKKTGAKYYAICRIHKKNKIPLPIKCSWNKKITDDIEKKIIKEYINGGVANKIAKKYGFKRKETVYACLKKRGIKRREPKIQTHYKEDFFKKIDSSEKAYIFGLIMTDGYIIKKYDGFGIQLTKNDGYILKKIRNLIGGSNPITHINCSTRRKNMPNAKDMARLCVFNKKIAMDLKKLGVLRNKSKVLRYNGCVPKKFINSFFRGLIDGDGCIYRSNSGRYQIQLSSASVKFLEDLSHIKSKFKFHIHNSIHKNGNIYYNLYLLGGRKACISFLKWIYSNKKDLFLRRKYAKVQNKINKTVRC
jgi:DNA-binding transcriptional regulator WhiA